MSIYPVNTGEIILNIFSFFTLIFSIKYWLTFYKFRKDNKSSPTKSNFYKFVLNISIINAFSFIIVLYLIKENVGIINILTSDYSSISKYGVTRIDLMLIIPSVIDHFFSEINKVETVGIWKKIKSLLDVYFFPLWIGIVLMIVPIFTNGNSFKMSSIIELVLSVTILMKSFFDYCENTITFKNFWKNIVTTAWIVLFLIFSLNIPPI